MSKKKWRKNGRARTAGAPPPVDARAAAEARWEETLRKKAIGSESTDEWLRKKTHDVKDGKKLNGFRKRTEASEDDGLAIPKFLVRKPRLYLAYGSNLNKRDMKIRCPGARPVGTMMLDGGRLVFRGVADVACEIGWTCPVGIWEITPDNEVALDRYEGVRGGFYDKEELDIGDGKTALIYFMNAVGIMRPSQYYVDTIRQGYRDFGLDEKYLDAAIWHSIHDKEPCPATTARRERQLQSTNQKKLVRIPDDAAFRRLERVAARRRGDRMNDSVIERVIDERKNRAIHEIEDGKNTKLPGWDSVGKPYGEE